MPIRQFLTRLLSDPPPSFVFELSEAGIAVARNTRPPQIGFRALEPDVLAVSPVKDNVLRPDALAAAVRELAGEGDAKKTRRSVLVLPDYCIRVSVLDFDSFPSDVEEQRSLLRFRIKKTVPFDIDTASLSYHVQNGMGKKVDVVAAVAPHDVVSHYEAPFRAAGFHPGLVTSSALAALELLRSGGITVLAKLTRRFLTIAVTAGQSLKLIRSIELAELVAAEVNGHLYQTFAYIEDQLESKTERLALCGMGALEAPVAAAMQAEMNVPAEPLRSRFGEPGEFNAGLVGYLEALRES